MKVNHTLYNIRYWILILLAILGSQVQLRSQTLVSQDFATWPPTGWIIENQGSNWSSEFSVQAGGQPPEARLNGSPSFFNTTRLISPAVNLSGINVVSLEFNYMMDVIGPGFSIGIATRNGSSPWQTVWSTVLYASTPCVNHSVLISNANTNQANFQFCLFFLGNSQNINAWYIDDIKLLVPPLHDVGLISYLGQGQYSAGTPFVPAFAVKNSGLSTENALPFTLQIFDSSDVLIYNSTQFLQNFSPGLTDTVTFPSYALPQANSLYKYKMLVSLQGDNNHGNDTLSGIINTFELISKKFVLLESGTVTWCPHCPPAAVSIAQMLSSGSKLAVIGYHGAFGDPFNNAVANNRLAYYNILGFPTAYFDGVISHTGSSSSSTLYPAYYAQRVNVKTPFDMQIYGAMTNNNGTLQVVIRKVAPLVNPNLVLQVFLTESEIPHIWQTQTQVDHLARMMITGESGMPIDLVNNVNLKIPLSFTKNAAWISGHCEIIAFVQDTITKEIFQVDKIGLNALTVLSPLIISGNVRYDNSVNSPLSGVTVKLMQGPFVISTTQTDADGVYTFHDVIPGNYALRCTSSAPWGGVNAVDALMILKHFAGINLLSPFRIVAADADASNFLNSVDALTVSKRFVGFISSFAKGDWVFDSPLVTVSANQDVQQNIKGICRGDVNATYIP